MSVEQRYIGEILVRRGALEPDKLEAALETAAERAIDLRDFLVATHTVEDDKVVRALADEVGIEFVEKLTAETIPEDLIDAVPAARRGELGVVGVDARVEHVQVRVFSFVEPHVLAVHPAVARHPWEAPVGRVLVTEIELGDGQSSAPVSDHETGNYHREWSGNMKSLSQSITAGDHCQGNDDLDLVVIDIFKHVVAQKADQ